LAAKTLLSEIETGIHENTMVELNAKLIVRKSTQRG
jgi:DNA-binding LacI/PurR family transcriptional regulator